MKPLALLAALWACAPALPARADEARRHLMVWKLHQRAEGNQRFLEELLSSAKRRGFDTFCTDVPWGKVERRRGRYDFTAVEREARLAVDKGFLLVIKINSSFLESAIPSWIGEDSFMRRRDGSVYRDRELANPQLVFTSAALTKRLVRFHRATVRHFERRFPGRVLFYMSSLTPLGETEYAFADELDYSEHAQKAFRAWLRKRYGSIEALNARWRTGLSGFDAIAPATYNRTDWFQFRADALGALFAELSAAVRGAGGRYGAQFGSLWDAISWKRGTLHAAGWVEHLDWIVIDDAPTYDHRFSCDLARTIARGRPFSNEIDSDRHPDATDERYGRQLAESFAHGATMVDLANWEIELENGLDNPRWTFLAGLERRTAEAVVRPQPRKAIYLSTWAQYAHAGASPYKFVIRLYEALTGGGNDPVDILVDGVFESEPALLERYTGGIYLPAYDDVISDRAAAALARASVPLHKESDSVGSRNEYGDPREFSAGSTEGWPATR